MLGKVHATALAGVEAYPIEVEVRVSEADEFSFTIIGLCDSAIREARDRVTSALRHSGFKVPKRILVNLAPAELRKEGASFDLSIAIGILVASEQISPKLLENSPLNGELSLDGRIKAVRGTVAALLHARERKAPKVIVPFDNRREAALVPGIEIWLAKSLRDLVSMVSGESAPRSPRLHEHCEQLHTASSSLTFADVCGQEAAKRAMLIAAAGGHNILIIRSNLTQDFRLPNSHLKARQY